MINKIIHQIWISTDNEPMPDFCMEFSLTWKENNPDFTYMLWDNNMAADLVNNNYPGLKELYNNCAYDIQRIDLLKYLILHHYGGVYVDLDYECTKSISDLFSDHDCYLSEESSAYKVLGNAFLASVKDSLFLTYLINELPAFFKNNENIKTDKINYVLNTTGPGMVGMAYQNFSNKDIISIILPIYLSPIDAEDSRRIFREGRITEEIEQKIEHAYAVHYFFSMWLNEESPC